MSILAIDGGVPVRPEPLRGGFHGSAEIDAHEIDEVLEVLNSKLLFRHLAEAQGTSRAAWLEEWYQQRLGEELCAGGQRRHVGPDRRALWRRCRAGRRGDHPRLHLCGHGGGRDRPGAVPVIAEVDASLNMDPADLERKITPYTRAVMPVHMRGVPARMDEIMAVAQAHQLVVVEDVAQSNGGQLPWAPAGHHGRRGLL